MSSKIQVFVPKKLNEQLAGLTKRQKSLIVHSVLTIGVIPEGVIRKMRELNFKRPGKSGSIPL